MSQAARPTSTESRDPNQATDRKGEWRRSAQTKSAVTDAARRLFNDQGYENTSIHDIVRESGVSVGSIYHQFGGKSEVLRALVNMSMSRHKAVSSQAVQDAIADGETDPLRIYAAGAKAFLLDTWEHRDIDRVSLNFEGPSDVLAVSRDDLARFIASSSEIVLGNAPLPDCDSYALFGVLTAAARRLVDIDERDMAAAVVDYFIELLLRMGSSKP
ncbi:helix-turn-helix domain containing protein [Rhodococcus sp. T2V]|nr:helix-turn-helix domain containing protein [Rhodococcus sp. T2V]